MNSTSTPAHHAGGQGTSHEGTDLGPYRRLAVSLALSYLVMFAAMFARVDRFDNVYVGLNQIYMAGLMVAPMLLIMLATMRSMFGHPTLNRILAVAGVAALVLCWVLLRNQVGVDDRQMMRSMIPHHAGAILVCEQASLSNPPVQRLCRGIIDSQRREIREMKDLMAQRG
jgi:hypothetical protein